MISTYFKDFHKKLVKTTTKATAKKGSAKGTTKKVTVTTSLKALKEQLAGIVPVDQVVTDAKPIDSSGFSPDGADLVAYKPCCADIVEIMGGYVPSELLCGTFHVVADLNKDSLHDVLKRIETVKKLNYFADQNDGEEKMSVPAFIIAYKTSYKFLDLKNDIINYYMANNIEHNHELDILIVLNKGSVVKNWRERRNFIAIETNEDTSMWFFVLMNEYLNIERNHEIDLRKYIKKDVVYNEF